jgi:hypothetical protein
LVARQAKIGNKSYGQDVFAFLQIVCGVVYILSDDGRVGKIWFDKI